jgi:hypothetical protein
MPFFSTGNALRTDALRFASHERKMHQKDTSKNCMTVRVTGRGKAVKIAFEEVFVRMDVAYHNAHRDYDPSAQMIYIPIQGIRTMSLKDMGALSESAISCAFSLMLAFRVRTVLIASLKLFCLPCLVPALALPFAQELHSRALDVFLAGHRSLECRPDGRPFSRGFGDESRDGGSNVSSCRSLNLKSVGRSGNLKLLLGLAEEERLRSGPVA